MTKIHYINPLMQFGNLEFSVIIQSDVMGMYQMNRGFKDSVSEEFLIQDANTLLNNLAAEFNMPIFDEDGVMLETPKYNTNDDVVDIKIDWPAARRNS